MPAANRPPKARRPAVFRCAVVLLLVATAAAGTACAQRQPKVPEGEAEEVTRAADLDAILEKADANWKKRLKAERLEKALAGYERAANVTVAGETAENRRRSRAALWTRIARGWQFMADAHLPEDSQRAVSIHEKGLAAAKRAAWLQAPALKPALQGGASLEDALSDASPQAVPGMYWYAIHLGQWAMGQGMFTAMQNRTKIEAAMSFVCDHDPDYHFGGCHRYWGAYWTRLPMSKDAAKSRKNFEQAIETAPHFLMTKVVMASHWAPLAEDRQRFKSLLESVVEAEISQWPGIRPENEVAQRKAREMLDNIENYF